MLQPLNSSSSDWSFSRRQQSDALPGRAESSRTLSIVAPQKTEAEAVILRIKQLLMPLACRLAILNTPETHRSLWKWPTACIGSPPGQPYYYRSENTLEAENEFRSFLRTMPNISSYMRAAARLLQGQPEIRTNCVHLSCLAAVRIEQAAIAPGYFSRLVTLEAEDHAFLLLTKLESRETGHDASYIDWDAEFKACSIVVDLWRWRLDTDQPLFLASLAETGLYSASSPAAYGSGPLRATDSNEFDVSACHLDSPAPDAQTAALPSVTDAMPEMTSKVQAQSVAAQIKDYLMPIARRVFVLNTPDTHRHLRTLPSMVKGMTVDGIGYRLLSSELMKEERELRAYADLAAKGDGSTYIRSVAHKMQKWPQISGTCWTLSCLAADRIEPLARELGYSECLINLKTGDHSFLLLTKRHDQQGDVDWNAEFKARSLVVDLWRWRLDPDRFDYMVSLAEYGFYSATKPPAVFSAAICNDRSHVDL